MDLNGADFSKNAPLMSNLVIFVQSKNCNHCNLGLEGYE